MRDDEDGPAGHDQRPVPDNRSGRIVASASMAAMRHTFLDFFEAEYHPVVRFMMRNGADLGAAEDAAQEAFVRGWRQVLRGQWSQVSHPRAWIRKVAFNHHRARPWREISTAPPPDHAVPGPGHAELTGQARDVVAALSLIDDHQARAVIAMDMDDIPGHAIAVALDLSEQRVRDLRKKAIRTLKKHLSSPVPRSAQTPRPAGIDGKEGQ